ncbi:MAG: type II toxin-antitoxin system HicA family toxin [Candidatus Obscuribacterales bacterium]|nr:type II toxin-antitoxin system HicA family toxin [Candidatus Obscuribacterales bacterium]
MKARELLKILKDHGCVQVRQKGSHIRIQCRNCSTTVPYHPGEDLGRGLLKQIEKDLAPCLGQGWLNL